MNNLYIKVVVTLKWEQLGQGNSIVYASWADFEGNFLQRTHKVRSEQDEKAMYEVFESCVHNSIYCSLKIYEKRKVCAKEISKLGEDWNIDMESGKVLELRNKIDRISSIIDNLKISYVGASNG